MFGLAVRESEFGDAGFIELAEAGFGHFGVLLPGGFGEGEVEALGFGEGEGDAGIFGGVFCGEEAGVVAVLHIFAIGLEDARVGTGEGEDFAEHG